MRSVVIAFGCLCAAVAAASADTEVKLVTGDLTTAPTVTLPLENMVDLAPPQAPYEFFEPDGVSAFVAGKFVLIKWTPVKGAKGYNVYRKQPGGSYGSPLNTSLLTYPTDHGNAAKLYDSLMPQSLYPMERAHIKKLTTGEFYPNFTDVNNEPALRQLGNLYYQLLLIIGQAYADQAVQIGQRYIYRVRAVDAANVEHDLAREVEVVAGYQRIPSPPTGVAPEAGDTRVQLLWNDPPAADTLGGYHVYRGTSPTGPFARCDSTPVLTRIRVTLGGDTLRAPRFGYIDKNLTNYTTYYYYVVPRDPLGSPGLKSAIVKAMPRDLTPPQFPKHITVTAQKKTGIVIRWDWVNEDTWVPNPRAETVTQYRLFRYPDYQTAVGDTGTTSKYQIATITETQSKPGIHSIADTIRIYTDNKVTPEKVYWYRLSSDDNRGNTGRKSAAVSGLLPDIEPPDPPGPPIADGYDDHILISWSKPSMTKKKNQDLSGYLLYRGICGGWHEEIYRDEGNIYVYHPYPLHLLKDITDIDSLSYKDYSIPKGSPICYRYALKAYDKPQNLSAMSDSVCQRLHDRTPPEPPVVIALQARDQAIHLEAVAPPVQDMSGFVVERAEQMEGTYQIIYTDPVPADRGCHDLPASADSVIAHKVNQLSWTDPKVLPKKVYWYRVRAFDRDQNQSAPSPAVSTFAYEIRAVGKPAQVTAQAKRRDDLGCAVQLSWHGPRSNRFVVYRSFRKSDGYRQLGPPVTDARYEDAAVAPGMTCYYRVQTLASNGDRSALSDPVSITLAQ